MPRAAWLAWTSALLLVGCDLSSTHAVRGRVVGFGDDGRTLFVEHAPVPGFLEPMTRPFKTDGTSDLGRFRLGDAVAFSLRVTPDSAWIYDLQRLPDSAVARRPADDGRLAYPGRPSILVRGDPLPDVRLVDQDGKPLRLSDFRSQTLVLTFFYAGCPDPEHARLLRRFARLQPRLRARYGPDVRLLAVSIDPARDTPDVLATHARRHTDDLATWTFATGTPEAVGMLVRRFGMFYERRGERIDHSLITAVVGPDGRIAEVWRDGLWEPDEVMDVVARSAEG